MSLNLINDSQQTWYCKIGPTIPALGWGTMASTVVAAATAALAIPTALKVNGLQVSDVPAEFLSPYSGQLASGVVQGNTRGTKLGASLSENIIKYLKDKNYNIYEPRQARHTTKTSASEEIHVDCKKIILSDNFVGMYSFWNNVTTGSTEGSSVEYSVSKWEAKSLRTPEIITLVGSSKDGPANVKPSNDVGKPDTSKKASMSVTNDSREYWYCRMGGSDIANVKWQSLAAPVTTAVTKALAISPALTTKGLDILGVPKKYLEAYNGPYANGVVYALEKPNTKFGAVLGESITSALTNQDYFLIPPGKKRYTTQTSVNEQQAVDCKKIFVSDNHVAIYTVWNQVAAGAKEGGSNDYSINKWAQSMGAPELITGNLAK